VLGPPMSVSCAHNSCRRCCGAEGRPGSAGSCRERVQHATGQNARKQTKFGKIPHLGRCLSRGSSGEPIVITEIISVATHHTNAWAAAGHLPFLTESIAPFVSRNLPNFGGETARHVDAHFRLDHPHSRTLGDSARSHIRDGLRHTKDGATEGLEPVIRNR
jgi:hypothetical protein